MKWGYISKSCSTVYAVFQPENEAYKIHLTASESIQAKAEMLIQLTFPNGQKFDISLNTPGATCPASLAMVV